MCTWQDSWNWIGCNGSILFGSFFLLFGSIILFTTIQFRITAFYHCFCSNCILHKLKTMASFNNFPKILHIFKIKFDIFILFQWQTKIGLGLLIIVTPASLIFSVHKKRCLSKSTSESLGMLYYDDLFSPDSYTQGEYMSVCLELGAFPRPVSSSVQIIQKSAKEFKNSIVIAKVWVTWILVISPFSGLLLCKLFYL